MSVLTFTAKINLTGSNPQIDPDVFELSFTVLDQEGVFSGFDVAIGDVIYLDTGALELGTITKYRVESVTTQSFTDAVVMARFVDNNTSTLDPSASIGLDGFVSRPTVNNKFNIVPSPGAQLLPDKFAIYPINSSFGIADTTVGLQGVTGVAGINGATGVQGIQGPQGPQGLIEVSLFDSLSTSLPSGTSATIDGISVTNGMIVVFSSLSSNNFKSYIVSGVGVSLSWTPYLSFANQSSATPSYGDRIRVTSGTAYKGLDLFFDYNWELLDRNIAIVVAGQSLSQHDPLYISSGNAAGDTSRITGQAYKYEVDNEARNNFIGIATSAVSSGDLVKIQSSGTFRSNVNFTSNAANFMKPVWANNSGLDYGSSKPAFYNDSSTAYVNPMESYVGLLIALDEISMNVTNTPSLMKQFVNVTLANSFTTLFSPVYETNSLRYTYTAILTSPTLGSVVNIGNLVVVNEGGNYISNCTFVGTDIGFKLDVHPTSGDITYIAPTSTISFVPTVRLTGSK